MGNRGGGTLESPSFMGGPLSPVVERERIEGVELFCLIP